MAATRQKAPLCFVTRGDPAVGLGHVRRCLTLARLFRTRFTAAFCLTVPDSVSASLIRRAGFAVVTTLPAAWRDAGAAPGIVIVDHPEERPGYYRALRGRAKPALIAALDHHRMDTPGLDLVINLHPNYMGPARRRWAYPCISGWHLAILRDEFTRARKQYRLSPGCRRLLIVHGGTDHLRYTLKTLRRLRTLPAARTLDIDIVIGPYNADRERILALAATRPRWRAHCHIERMDPLMRRADLAICAGGSTAIELAHTGVPMLIMPESLAERQLAGYLIREGAALDGAPNARLGAALAAAMRAGWRKTAHRAARRAFDGDGKRRIVRLLEEVYHYHCRERLA